MTGFFKHPTLYVKVWETPINLISDVSDALRFNHKKIVLKGKGQSKTLDIASIFISIIYLVYYAYIQVFFIGNGNFPLHTNCDL